MTPTCSFTMRLRAGLPALLAMLICRAAVSQAQTSTNALAHRFENDVRAYEAADRSNMPPQGAILLAGDSQFFRWKTVNEDLAGYTIINRGIDGFETPPAIAEFGVYDERR